MFNKGMLIGRLVKIHSVTHYGELYSVTYTFRAYGKDPKRGRFGLRRKILRTIKIHWKF